jgi:hypothetical protein
MSNPESTLPRCPDYLGTLQQFLDLAMHTAQTASAEGDHRLVLQAIREGTRIIALINKMTGELTSQSTSAPRSTTLPNQAFRAGGPKNAAPTGKREKSGKTAGKIPFLGNILTLFQDDGHTKKSAGKTSQAGPQNASPPVPKPASGPPVDADSGDPDLLFEEDELYDFCVNAFTTGKLDVEALMAIGTGKPTPPDQEVAKTGSLP